MCGWTSCVRSSHRASTLPNVYNGFVPSESIVPGKTTGPQSLHMKTKIWKKNKNNRKMIQFKHTLRRNHYHHCQCNRISTFHHNDTSSSFALVHAPTFVLSGFIVDTTLSARGWLDLQHLPADTRRHGLQEQIFCRFS